MWWGPWPGPGGGDGSVAGLSAGGADTCWEEVEDDDVDAGAGAPRRGREVIANAAIIATMPAAPKRRRAVKGSRSRWGSRRFSTGSCAERL